MILAAMESAPPQIHATRSKLKIPMLPQLSAPTMVSSNAILSINIYTSLKISDSLPLLSSDAIILKNCENILFASVSVANTIFNGYYVIYSVFYLFELLFDLLKSRLFYSRNVASGDAEKVSNLALCTRPPFTKPVSKNNDCPLSFGKQSINVFKGL